MTNLRDVVRETLEDFGVDSNVDYYEFVDLLDELVENIKEYQAGESWR